MKKAILLSILLNLCYFTHAQKIKFSQEYNDADIQDAFTLLGVQNFKFTMPTEFKACYFDLIVKEYFEGKEINITSQFDRLKKMKQVLFWSKEKEEYVLKVQSIKHNDSIEKFNVRMPAIGLRGIELKLKSPRSNYDWAALTNDTTVFSTEKGIPILTFSSTPSNARRPNTAVYCELANSSQDQQYLNWYNTFKIKHCYIIFIKVIPDKTE